MKIVCQHGFYKFTETKVGQLSQFMAMSKFQLVPFEDYYTFEELTKIGSYCLKGKMIGTVPSKLSYSGTPWDILEKNGLVFDPATKIFTPIASMPYQTTIGIGANKFIANGLIFSGMKTPNGIVKNFTGWYLRDKAFFYYTGIEYV